MKKTELPKAIDQVVKLKLRAVDSLISTVIEQLEDFGNPEKLIGKSYEEWTAQDLTFLTQVYGKEDNSALANLIFRKEYARVKELESEEFG